MMSVAVLFCVAAVGLAYYRTPAERVRRRRALAFGAAPVFAGVMLSVNTWSFPTVLGVTALSVILADPRPATLLPWGDRSLFVRERAATAELQRVLGGVAVAAVAAVLGAAVVWPFVWNVLLVGASSRNIAFLPGTTQFGAFVLVHGVFLVALGTYLVARAARGWRDWAAAVLAAFGLSVLAASFDLVVAGVSLDFVGLALAGPLVAGGWLLRRWDRVGYEGVLVAAGAGLVVLVEFVYLSDGAAGGRFNTVFKVYAQVWALWAVAGGVALAGIATRGVDTTRVRAGARTALVVALVVSASVYGALAVSGHFARMDDATIDGMEYVHDTRPGQATAVEWLLDKPGQPHITSAPGVKPYTWESPAASLTGIPTVAGWIQEVIYRGEEPYWDRVRDLEILYETEEARSRAVLLRKHDVRYVWVGPNEREMYDVAVMADEPGIELAIATSSVRVYAVNQTELTATKN
jgi:YYY domain-containing protein